MSKTTRLHSRRPQGSKVYYTLKHGVNMQLSPNFKLHEFQCEDGTHVLLVHPALVTGLQRLRDHFGRPVTINSAFRTHAHNNDVGGVQESRHLWGMAADVVIDEVPPTHVRDWAENEGWGGIGYYYSFTHLDVQGRDRRWGPAL